MTREELRDYVDEQRTLNNIPYHVYSALIDGIDTLEQEPILDKIRAEIERKRSFQRVMEEYDIATGLRKALEIIDKYKAESEDKGVLEQLAEKQNNLSATNKAWSDVIEKNGYVN